MAFPRIGGGDPEPIYNICRVYCFSPHRRGHTQGFGFQFCENQFCKGVLTLYFDDIIREVDGAVLFTDEMADQIIAFVLAHRSVETLLVHCYGGQSRSRAVGAFAVEMLGGNSKRYFETGSPNQYVYDVLETAWIRRQLGAF